MVFSRLMSRLYLLVNISGGMAVNVVSIRLKRVVLGYRGRRVVGRLG